MSEIKDTNTSTAEQIQIVETILNLKSNNIISKDEAREAIKDIPLFSHIIKADYD